MKAILVAIFALFCGAAQAQVYQQTGVITMVDTSVGTSKWYLKDIVNMCNGTSGPAYAYMYETDTGWKSNYPVLALASVSGQTVTIWTTYTGGACKIDTVRKVQ